MVNKMLEITKVEQTCTTDEVEHAEDVSTYLHIELLDGRLAPVESGGLVELALNELGAELVDFVEDPVSMPEPGLN
jgi:hypothetical protein